jgi:hypothetical protein
VLALLKASGSRPEWPNLAFLSAQLTAFASAMQALETGATPVATQALEAMDTALRERSATTAGRAGAVPVQGTPGTAPTVDVLPDALLSPIMSTLAVMALELRGAVAFARGQTAEAATVFDEAAKKEKELGYREPPIYIRPVYEAKAAALMRAGEWAGAHEAYEQALIERPHSGFGLYGLAMCSEKAGDAVRAKSEYATFLAAWQRADSSLPQLAHARAYVRGH